MKQLLVRWLAILMRQPRPVGSIARLCTDLFRLIRLRAFAAINARRSQGARIDPLQIIFVDPCEITHCAVGIHKVRGATWQNVGAVRGGDWDLAREPFQDLRSFAALRDRLIRGRAWCETLYYRAAVKRIERGHVLWGCTTIEEFDSRCAGIDALFEAIRKDGYRSQRAVLGSTHVHGRIARLWREWDEVVVSIGRSGELLFCDGQHRLAIAKLLGLRSIPVRVLVRHSRWQELRTQFEAVVDIEHGGVQPHAPLHADLSVRPVAYDSSRIVEMMAANVERSYGRVLEIGGGVSAYFSRWFADRGFECFILEDTTSYAAALRDAKKLGVLHITILDGTLDSSGKHCSDVAIWSSPGRAEIADRTKVERVARLTADHLFIVIPPAAAGSSDVTDSALVDDIGRCLVTQCGFKRVTLLSAEETGAGGVLHARRGSVSFVSATLQGVQRIDVSLGASRESVCPPAATVLTSGLELAHDVRDAH